MRVNSTERPNKFWHNEIGDKVELVLHENIEEVTKDGEVSFDSDMSFGVAANNRDEIIAGFIRLKYSIDKEFALFHKGRLDPTNVEYLEYLDYRVEVKEYVGQ